MWSGLIWQYVPIIYKNDFNISPFVSSFILVTGDAVGGFIIFNEILDNKCLKIKCFREPIKISVLIVTLGIFILLIIAPNIIFLIIGNVVTSIIYVMINQICGNYIFIFAKGKMIKTFSSYFSISCKIAGLISSIMCPFLFDIDYKLPFQVLGSFAIGSGIFVFCVFKRHIRLYYNENIFSLSKSIFKLELERQVALEPTIEPTIEPTLEPTIEPNHISE
jgi:hypothetical protein